MGDEVKVEGDEIWCLVLGEESWVFQDKYEIVEKMEESAEGLDPEEILAFRVSMSGAFVQEVEWRELILKALEDKRQRKEDLLKKFGTEDREGEG